MAVLLLAAAHRVSAQAPDYFSPANILRFADSLYDEKDYRRAAAEYNRFLSAPGLTPAESASAHLKMGMCFRLALDYPRAVSAFRSAVAAGPGTDAAREADFQIAHTLFISGHFAEAATAVPSVSSDPMSDDTLLGLQQLKGMALLGQRQWNEAGRHLRSVTSMRAGDPITSALVDIAEEGARLRPRSPLVAGVLSAVIPGTGRIYAGRTADGLLSAITIAAVAWQAYDGFRGNGTGSAKGWIYGSLGTIFYLGDIYGSVAAVRVSNEDAANRLLGKMRVAVSMSVRFK